MEEKEIVFDIVIIGNPLLKYSRFAFGTAFTNIGYLITDKVSKTQKNLEEYFKIYGPIVDYEGNQYVFKNVTIMTSSIGTLYHLNFK